MTAQTTTPTSEPDLTVQLGPLALAHPLLNASGTYDVLETAAHYEGDAVATFPFAAYVPKTVTLEPRIGNPPPRVTETPSGVINSVGLANPGLAHFLDELPLLARLPVPLIVSVGGAQPADYVTVVRRIEETVDAAPAGALPPVSAYELNVSCPNVTTGLAVGTDAVATAALVAALRQVTKRFLIVKLTPNVTDISAIARAAVTAGADAVSLVNTFKGLVLEAQTLRPFLGGKTGGVSGPAIKPLALRLVAEVAAAVNVPIIGMGGIASGHDVLEFIACGATAVAIGTANFAGLGTAARILGELRDEMRARGLTALAEVRGAALVGE